MGGSQAAAIRGDVEAFAFPLTDAGNAERFVHRNAGRVIYVHGWDRWLVWDGARWAQDDRRQVYQLAIETARAIHAEAANATSAADAAAASKHAIGSEKRERLEAMLALARTLPPLAVGPDDLDANSDLLNLPNGSLDLLTGQLGPHDRQRHVTKCAAPPWDPDARAPHWQAFLERVIPDPDVRAYLQRATGYALTGCVSEHCLFFCYGTGANGKSTYLETIRELLGEGEYARAAAPDLLLSKKQERHAVELADLRGFRFVTTVEVGEGRAWDEARVKWLTGGDTISARLMYGNPFTFQPTHKFWVAANHRPRVNGTDHGFWRRVHFIPFTVTIPKAEQDPNLRAKLSGELDGILRWAVEGCLAWRHGGLRPPAAVLGATEAYKAGEDVLAAFLDEVCVQATEARVLVGALYDEFKKWVDRNGERHMTNRAFGDALEERGVERKKSNGHRWFVGLGLRQGSAE
jgi:putative DNA primase/helicase